MESSEKFKKEYRDNAKKLLVENETLQDKLTRAEKDTIQVISFLKAEDTKKDEKVTLDIFCFFWGGVIPLLAYDGHWILHQRLINFINYVMVNYAVC